jgi:hypothetical protein
MKALKVALLVFVLAVSLPSPALAKRCGNGRSADGAMWLSILHPGLGEYFLKGWGDFSKAPPKKFWLGFIPLFGWPGYLQAVSATDALHCRTNDWNG